MKRLTQKRINKQLTAELKQFIPKSTKLQDA